MADAYGDNSSESDTDFKLQWNKLRSSATSG